MAFTEKIKAIAVDLDGTLLYPKKYMSLVTRSNVKFLKEFSLSGGKIIIVTGRNPKMKKKLEKKLGCKVTYIGCNGSYIIDENNQLIFSKPLDNNMILKLFHEQINNKTIKGWMLFSLKNEMYVYTKINLFLMFLVKVVSFMRFAYSERLIFSKKKFLKEMENTDNYKLMPVLGISTNLHKLAYDNAKLLQQHYGEYTNISQSSSSIEITNIEANKAATLEKYLKDINLNKDQVVVIGDSGNDVPMFEHFANSFCMNHADEWVKEHAKYTVKKVSDVREYLQKYNEDKLS